MSTDSAKSKGSKATHQSTKATSKPKLGEYFLMDPNAPPESKLSGDSSVKVSKDKEGGESVRKGKAPPGASESMLQRLRAGPGGIGQQSLRYFTTSLRSFGEWSKRSFGFGTREERANTLNEVKKIHDDVLREEKVQVVTLIIVICIIVLSMIILLAVIIVRVSAGKSDDETNNSSVKAIYNLTGESTGIPFVNLTLECIKMHGDCFYFKGLTHTNCKERVPCHTVTMNVKYSNVTGMFDFTYSNEIKLVEAIDRIYAGNGEWCIGGKRVPLAESDPRRRIYTLEKHGGGYNHNCRKMSCIKAADNKTEEALKKISSCSLTGAGQCATHRLNEHSHVLLFHFLSCNNPLPVDSAPECFSGDTGISPLAPFDRCEMCNLQGTGRDSIISFLTNLSESGVRQCLGYHMAECGVSCPSQREPMYAKFGATCKQGQDNDRYPSYCLRGLCVPLLRYSPEVMPFRVNQCSDSQ